MKRALLLIALLLTMTVNGFAQSAVPPNMSFQGRLAKPDGTPVSDGNYKLTFTLYDAAVAGNVLWQQVSPTVAVRNGAFIVKLDFSAGFTMGQTIDSVFAITSYLDIKVGADPSLTPRQPFTTNAYAFRSKTAEVALNVADGSITLAKIAPGVLNFSNIGGQVTGAQIANGAVSSANLNSTLMQTLHNLGNAFGPALVGSAPTGNFPEALFVAGNYAYVANSNSNTLQIFDVSNPLAPTLKSSIGTGSSPDSVTVSGSAAYVVNFGSATLQIFDVSNPAAPVLKSTTPTGNGPQAVVVASNLAYVVNYSASSLQIFDVSNIAAPVLKSTTVTGSNPLSLAVAGSFAYVGNYVGNSMQIFNVANPAAPTLKSTTATGSNPYSVTVSGSNAYIVNYTSSNLQIFDVSNVAAPVLKSTTATAATGPIDVAVSGSYAYVSAIGGSLQVFNVTNVASPVSLTSIPTANDPFSIASVGNYIYLVSAGSNVLQIFDVFGTLQVNGNLYVTGNGTFNGNLTASNATIPTLNGSTTINNELYVQNNFVGVGRSTTVSGAEYFGVYAPVTSGYGGMYIETNGSAAKPFYGYSLNGNFDAYHYLDGNDGGKWKLYNNGGFLTFTQSGSLGVGTTSPDRDVTVTSSNGTYLNLRDTAGPYEVLIGADAGGGIVSTMTNHDLQLRAGGNTTYMTIKANGNVGIGTSAPAAFLDVNGVERVHAVNIIGGSDVAEPYAVSAAGRVKPVPGMIVTIDPERIGKMRVATRAYDRTVGGIISGANGIQPGITLQQKGTVADGTYPIASIGRVWAWCDADANGAITAGDMLTTSSTPGYAMRVTNHRKADGAIIGKAMSSLKHGKGLVLVLVSLK